MIEEMALHEHAVASGMLAGDADVFIQIECRDLAEAVILPGTLGNHAIVHADWRASRWQAEDSARIGADGVEEDGCRALRERVVVGDDFPDHDRSFTPAPAPARRREALRISA